MTVSIKQVKLKPLTGRRAVLDVAAPHHAEFLLQVYSNEEFMNNYRISQDRNISLEKLRKKLELEEKCPPLSRRRIEWVINLQSDDSDNLIPVGIVSLADYRPGNRAELMIGIVDPSHRNGKKGRVFMEAMLLVLEFAFSIVRVNKVVNFVYIYNQVAQKNSLHFGFVQEGLLRDHFFDAESKKFISAYQNSMLREEYFQNKVLSRWSKRFLGRDIS